MKKSTIIIATLLTIAYAQDIGWYNADSSNYSISNSDELKGLQAIVANGIENFNGKTIELANDIALTGNFFSIGNKTHKFQGIFDGKGFTISGLSVNDNEYAGLFGYVGENGQIKNLNVIAVNIKETSKAFGRTYAGGLAGYYDSEKPIENSSVKADSIYVIRGSGLVGVSGGLVGYIKKGTISNSNASGYVSGGTSGCLVGIADTLTVENSYCANGNISSSYSSGGLIGNVKIGAIYNSHANGDVSSDGPSGGLVGDADTLTIENSYANGKISSSKTMANGFSGGLIGNGSKITISSSYASGYISGLYSGGLIGKGYKINIENSYANSYASGYVSAVDKSGGLIGNGNKINIESSYANGSVLVSSGISGGLVGDARDTLAISNSYYANGNVSGNISGGLVGKADELLTISSSYANGKIYGRSYSGGLVGEAEKIVNISNSYANGKISGTNSGGIFGRYSDGGPIYSSIYYNSEGATQASGKGSPLGISGIPSANLKEQSSFKNWDFENIWGINGEIIDGYPYLKWSENAIKEPFLKIGSFTDSRNSKKYKTAKIGKQTWMAENLNYNVKGSKCYDNKEANCKKYGRLYNWNIANNACPKGWHLPTLAEWNVLKVTIGLQTTGLYLKAINGWDKRDKDDGNGTDDYGFTALPGGASNTSGKFDNVGNWGYWWSASEYNYSRNIVIAHIQSTSSWTDFLESDHRNKEYSFSVRCVQD